MKHCAIHVVAIFGVLGLLGCEGGIGYPKSHTQKYTIHNKSSYEILTTGYIGESVSSDQCRPYYHKEDLIIAPESQKSLSLTTSCLGSGWRSSLSIQLLLKSFRIAEVSFYDPGMISRLSPGLQFMIISADKTLSTTIEIVAAPDSSIPRKPMAWSLPPVERTGIAWLQKNKDESWQLSITVPQTFMGPYVDVAFPIETGIKTFGNTMVREENGYYVGSNNLHDGPAIYIRGTGTDINVGCDDEGCSY